MNQRLGAAAVLVLALCACPIPEPRCAADADCEAGRHCDVGTGTCADGPSSASSSSSSGGASSQAGSSSTGSSSVAASSQASSSAGSSSAASASTSTSASQATSQGGSSAASTVLVVSSSDPGASSAGAASSAPGLDAGVPLSVDEACEEISMNLVMGVAFAQNESAAASVVCLGLTRDDLVREVLGSRARVRAFCTTATLPGVISPQLVLGAVDAGRLLYDGVLARRCLDDGALDVPSIGIGGAELHRFLELNAGKLPPRSAACATFLQGATPLGGACLDDGDCQQLDGPAECAGRAGLQCEGTCALVTLPRACGGGGGSILECPAGTVCVNSNCMPMARAGDACIRQGDDPSITSCAYGLACHRGTCTPRGAEGAPCDQGDECLLGLLCEPPPDGGMAPEDGGAAGDASTPGGRCVPPLAPGAACDPVGGRPCNICDTCEPVDGGHACVPTIAVGAPCVNGTCPFAMACVLSSCVRRVGTNEPCDLVDGEDADLRGTCAAADEACLPAAGGGRRCQPRTLPDAGCRSPSSANARQGSCERVCAEPEGCPFTLDNVASTYVCQREAPQDTAGRCTGAARVGQPCGNRYDLNPFCVTSTGAMAECSANAPSAVGSCVFREQGPQGGPCTRSEACRGGLYCAVPDGGVVGSCAPGAATGGACGDGLPWGSICQEGLCLDANDGGRVCSVAYRARGDTCASSAECGPQGRCDAVTLRCATLSDVDGPCTATRDCDPENPADLRCVATRCVPLACATDQGCADLDRQVRARAPYLTTFLLMGVLVARRRSRRA